MDQAKMLVKVTAEVKTFKVKTRLIYIVIYLLKDL